jgi:Xaa-Pro aminopeptidase
VWSENFSILPHQTQFLAVVAGTELETPRLVASLGEAANIFDHIGAAATPYFFGEFYRFVSATEKLTDLEQFVKHHVVDASPHGGIGDAAAEAIVDAGLAEGVIAYDERSIHPETLAAIVDRIPRARLVPGWDLFRRIRAVKTAEEQRIMAKAVEITQQAIAATANAARAGATEDDLIATYEKAVIDGGARPAFSQIAFGRRGGTGYVMDRSAPLGADEIIRFDVGCDYRGYKSDIARNFSLRQPDERAVRIHRAMLAGQDAAIACLRPGVIAADAFAAATAAIRDAGLADYHRHHVGHGIGLEVYDIPLLAPRDETPLEEGMVLCVETPYYELGYGGLQPEDAVVVTAGGGRMLGQLPREIGVVGSS